MTGTIGHLRNVADLVASIDIEAILVAASLGNHESATDLALEVEAAAASLREVAALVESAPTPADDSPSFTDSQVRQLRDEAATAGDIETVEACEAYLEDPEAGWAADIIDEAISYTAAQ